VSRCSCFVVSGLAVLVTAPAFAQNWVNFSNATGARLVAPAGLGVSDPQEKDFAWGDFDQDGDTDLVCVRKTPFSVAGRQRNVLFMNDGIAQGQAVNGVLVERTTQYASAADDGGQGMLDLTDDRDVVVGDVNGDGWLDIITATTYGQAFAKTISHPRIYINLGETAGVWQGFRYEQARIPALAGGAPNFCGVAIGDVTGDKAPDLYFTDYDRLTPSPYDDRLLINNGSGFFTDQSATRVTPISLLDSDFGTAAHIVDMNGDGWLDVVRSENGPVKTLYNNGAGNFTSMQNTFTGSAYFTSVGDLNNDGRFDIVISDDGTDRYLLNTGVNGSNQATFANLTLPNSGGFGATSRYADFNNDGFTDLVICDVDVDIPGCDRVTKLYRNLGNFPSPTMADQAIGLPVVDRTGIHDAAPIDLNNDGWVDLVLAKCSGITVWMNVPPSGLIFSYPQGLPGFVDSGQTFNFQVNLTAVGGTPAPNTGVLFYSINGAPFTSTPMSVVSGNLYQASLPPTNCTDIVRFYITGQLSGGGTFTDPANAPTAFYTAVSGDGTLITLDDNLEGSVSGWTVTNSGTLTGGAWQQADPNSTLNAGSQASPEDDAGAGTDVLAFITQNGAVGGLANAADVDGGPTWLTSPTIDLAGTDATISYDRWMYCEDAGTADGDLLSVEVSNNNGGSWTLVHTTGSTNGSWQNANFRVGEFVAPTAQVRVRFSTQDSPNNSVTEAGIDNFAVEELVCGVPNPCPADIAPVGGNDVVNVEDLLAVIGTWGACGNPDNCPADIAPASGDDVVNVQDLLAVIGAWGACP